MVATGARRRRGVGLERTHPDAGTDLAVGCSCPIHRRPPPPSVAALRPDGRRSTGADAGLRDQGPGRPVPDDTWIRLDGWDEDGDRLALTGTRSTPRRR
ncbi:MAG: hypothetical protein R2699_11655 [Acidimicrobiales bacterium]